MLYKNTGVSGGKFLTPLVVELISDAGDGIWQLRDPLQYYSEILGGVITADTGFVTDFASVPRLPVVYLMYGNKAKREATIHDLLYQCGNVERETADRIFLEAMTANPEITEQEREAMFDGVRLFGGSHKSDNMTLNLALT